MAIRNMLHMSQIKAFEEFLESKDCTFKEFTGWANARACDGRWSMLDAMNSVSIVSMVYEVKPIFFRGRVREALWRKLRDQYLNVEAEIEIER